MKASSYMKSRKFLGMQVLFFVDLSVANQASCIVRDSSHGWRKRGPLPRMFGVSLGARKLHYHMADSISLPGLLIAWVFVMWWWSVLRRVHDWRNAPSDISNPGNGEGTSQRRAWRRRASSTGDGRHWQGGTFSPIIHMDLTSHVDHARILAWSSSGSHSGSSWGTEEIQFIHLFQNLRPWQVVDSVLKEPGQPDAVLYNRAKVHYLSFPVIQMCSMFFSRPYS